MTFRGALGVTIEKDALREAGEEYLHNAKGRAALTELVHLLINGYGSLFQILTFQWHAGWSATVQHGQTIKAALKSYILKKTHFVDFYGTFREQTMSKILSASSTCADGRYAHIAAHLSQMHTFIKLEIYPRVNDPAHSVGDFWTAISLAFSVNLRRVRKGASRLPWDGSDFTWAWRQAMLNTTVRHTALLALPPDASAQLVQPSTAPKSTKPPKPTKTKPPKTMVCYYCEGAHRIKQCPLLKGGKATTKPTNTKSFITRKRRHQQMQQENQGVNPMLSNLMYPMLLNPMLNPLQAMAMQYPQLARMPHQLQQQQQQQHQQAEPAAKRQRQFNVGEHYYIKTGNGLKLRPACSGLVPCKWFAQGACSKGPLECMFPHFCTICKDVAHNAANCTNGNQLAVSGGQ